ncbi:MAG: hypothetical protein HY367_00555 [Candidatus Aenigmarchaeota archaeon]|nr:hypothetical protein [Candidatus Aenigmarchaeota archaeon]
MGYRTSMLGCLLGAAAGLSCSVQPERKVGSGLAYTFRTLEGSNRLPAI